MSGLRSEGHGHPRAPQCPAAPADLHPYLASLDLGGVNRIVIIRDVSGPRLSGRECWQDVPKRVRTWYSTFLLAKKPKSRALPIQQQRELKQMAHQTAQAGTLFLDSAPTPDWASARPADDFGAHLRAHTAIVCASTALKNAPGVEDRSAKSLPPIVSGSRRGRAKS